MRTLAIASVKGGVGKTTVTLGIASAAQRAGIPTLVADLDPQCNATAALAASAATATIATVLDDPRSATLLSAIAPSPWGAGLDVLTGSVQTEAHNVADPRGYRLGRLERVLGRLPSTGRRYGLVLIDCPPSLGQLTRAGLLAADGVLVITEPTLFSVSGVQRAVDAVYAERQRNPRLRPIGVLANRVKPRSPEHEVQVNELRALFGELVLPLTVPERAALPQAQGTRQPIHALRGKGAKETATMFDALLGHVRNAIPA